MRTLVLIASGGAVGALFRFGIGGWIHTMLGTRFPYGTLAVNTVGCLLIGWAGVVAEERGLGETFWLLLVIGFLGSFTTFSSLAYETWMLIRESSYLAAAGNMMANVVLGLSGVILGTIIGRSL